MLLRLLGRRQVARLPAYLVLSHTIGGMMDVQPWGARMVACITWPREKLCYHGARGIHALYGGWVFYAAMVYLSSNSDEQ